MYSEPTQLSCMAGVSPYHETEFSSQDNVNFDAVGCPGAALAITPYGILGNNIVDDIGDVASAITTAMGGAENVRVFGESCPLLPVPM